MRRVDVLQALLVVLSPTLVNIFVLGLDLNRKDLVPIDQFLCISCAIFGEVHVDEAREGVTVGTHPYVSMFVGSSVDYLLLKSFPLIPIAEIVAGLSIHCIVCHDPFSFLGIKLLYSSFFLFGNLIFVVLFKLPDFLVVLLLKLEVLSHHTMHV